MDQVNISLSTAADTTGSKLVLVDDGGADTTKFVTTDAATFGALCLEHAAALRVLKVKGEISLDDVAAFAGPLAGALALSAHLEEIVAKGATFEADARQAFVNVILGTLPAGTSVTIGKKQVLSSSVLRELGSAAAAAQLTSLVDNKLAARTASPPSIKLKLKMGRGVSSLLEPDRLAELNASTGKHVHGFQAPPIDQLKIRGPVGTSTVAAIAAVTANLSGVTTVKLARYYWSDAGNGEAVASALASALQSSALAHGRPVRLMLKCKGRPRVDVLVGGRSGDADAIDVDSVVRLLRETAMTPL